MALYYVNKAPQRGGDHEVHKEGCAFMPAYREVIGDFPNTASALTEARMNHFVRAVPCLICCRADLASVRLSTGP